GSDCDIRVLLVGNGPELENLQNYSGRSPKLRDRVVFLPPSLEVADLFRAMDIFVLPSIREGMSNTLLEAMSSGLACAATSSGGNPELIVDGQTGFLFTPANVDQLKSILHQLGISPEVRKRVGLEARSRILERFSLHGMVRQYEQLYSEMASA